MVRDPTTWLSTTAAIAAAIAALISGCHPGRGTAPSAPDNVVLVTWDGVRLEDLVAVGRDLPAPVWNSAANATGLRPMQVANTALKSLPGYQSLLAGRTTACLTNDCGRITEETFLEALVRKHGIPRAKVATFGSWAPIALAVERVPGTTVVNTGRRTFTPLPGVGAFSSDWLAQFNRAQVGNAPPWKNARWDRYTMTLARRYLRSVRPRFMFIALDDSDEWAHKGDSVRYRQTLATYDRWLKELMADLAGMGSYGAHTTILVTTDHGRGAGERWTDHGPDTPNARAAWFFVRGARTHELRVDNAAYTHLAIRPTIEALLGLCPAPNGPPSMLVGSERCGGVGGSEP